MVEQLVDHQLITTPADLYTLNASDLASIERTGDLSISNLLKGIEASTSRPFAKVLFGLGIRHVGKTAAETLAQAYPNIDALMSATADELEALPDIGPIVADALVTYFKNPTTQHVVAQLREAGVQLHREETTQQSTLLAGKSFVLTGSLETMTREEAGERIKQLGGKVSSSISKNTTYLIAGAAAGSKLTKAEKLGVPIMSETDLLDLLQSEETTSPLPPESSQDGQLDLL